MTTKVCSKCKVEKGRDEFYKNRSKSDGLASLCKICSYLRSAKWKKENPEKARASTRKWQQNNPEKAKVSCSSWQRNNPEKARDAKAKWAAENPLSKSSRAGRQRGIDELDDYYVKSTLGKSKLRASNPPQELIELKRLQLQIIREIKQQGK